MFPVFIDTRLTKTQFWLSSFGINPQVLFQIAKGVIVETFYTNIVGTNMHKKFLEINLVRNCQKNIGEIFKT